MVLNLETGLIGYFRPLAAGQRNLHLHQCAASKTKDVVVRLHAPVIPAGVITKLQFMDQLHLDQGSESAVDGTVRNAWMNGPDTLKDFHGCGVIGGLADDIKDRKPLGGETWPGFLQVDPSFS